MDESALAAPPPALARMLEWTRQRQTDSHDLFDDFLLYADRAVQESAGMQIGVEASYKLKDIRDITGKESFNDTLLVIFNFYCKLRQSAGTTFDATQALLEQLSFKELEILCRDFRVVPRLLSKEDLRLLWEHLVDKEGNKIMVSLINFDLFKIYFVRMALWAYHKPGLKKLILTLEGFMPTPPNVVKCFANYWHLHDSTFVANFLRTVSRKTQGDYNFRSLGEASSRTRLEILQDSSARKLAAAAKQQTAGKHSRPSTSDRGTRPHTKASARPSTAQATTATGALSSSQILTLPADNVPKKNGSVTNIFGETVKSPTITTPANPLNVVRMEERNYFPEKPSRLPLALLDKLHPRREGLLALKGELEEVQFAGIAHGFETHHDRDDDESLSEDARSVASSVASVFQDTSVESQLQNLEATYDPRLILLLDRYSYIPGKIASTEWIPSYGPMVDLGLLQPGTKVIINMQLINTSPDDVQIDVTARNFQSSDTQQRTFAKALIPGFKRNLVTTFTVPEDNRTVVGFIDVAILSVRYGGGGCVSCPVFYRVDKLATKDLYPKCTAYSLADLLAQRNQVQRLPGQTRTHAPLLATFEAKKLQGTWTRRTGKQSSFALSINR